MDVHQPARGNVLVVDDDNDVRDALTAILEDEGYQVTSVANGLDALNYLRAALPPCLILLDLMMPVMDGWLFRTTQMRDPALASIPVVVLSAFSNVPRLVANLNVADYIQKPVELETLLTTVERYCG
jgi:CheY-like chemotaxis protein